MSGPYDCDPSGEGCENCPRLGDDCDGNEEYWDREDKKLPIKDQVSNMDN